MIQLSIPLPTIAIPGVRAVGSPLVTTSDFALALADLAGAPPTFAMPPGDVLALSPTRQDVAAPGKDLPESALALTLKPVPPEPGFAEITVGTVEIPISVVPFEPDRVPLNQHPLAAPAAKPDTPKPVLPISPPLRVEARSLRVAAAPLPILFADDVTMDDDVPAPDAEALPELVDDVQDEVQPVADPAMPQPAPLPIRVPDDRAPVVAVAPVVQTASDPDPVRTPQPSATGLPLAAIPSRQTKPVTADEVAPATPAPVHQPQPTRRVMARIAPPAVARPETASQPDLPARAARRTPAVPATQEAPAQSVTETIAAPSAARPIASPVPLPTPSAPIAARAPAPNPVTRMIATVPTAPLAAASSATAAPTPLAAPPRRVGPPIAAPTTAPSFKAAPITLAAPMTASLPSTPAPIAAHATLDTAPAPVQAPVTVAAPEPAPGVVPPIPADITPRIVSPMVRAASTVFVPDAPGFTAPAVAPITVVALPAAPLALPQFQPAAQAFAAAMFVAAAASDTSGADERIDPLALVPTAPLAPVDPGAPAVAPVASDSRPTLDLTRDDWMASMIDHIETLRDEGGAVRETRMRLAPEALGTVEVSVRRDDAGAIQVRIAADTPQARAMLAEAAPKLAEMAEARGVRLSGSSVDSGTGTATADHGRREAPAAPTPVRRRAPVPAERAEDGITDSRLA